MKKVVLLLNMGGADNLNQVEVFLKNMFNDPFILTIENKKMRSILAWFITKMRLKSATSNYKKIGGKSPIGDITRSLISKLNLKFGNENLKFDYAMNYTPPFADEVLKKYENYDQIILFLLYPHHSTTTITSSLSSINKALNSLKIKAKIKIIDYFYKNNQYNNIIIENIQHKLGNLDPKDINLIFSAHSLPKKIIQKGDLYEKHINDHIRILTKILKCKKINFNSISLAYQSRLGPIEWLGPNLSEVLPTLSKKSALIYPISFCIDNSETDFELDIEYRHIANKYEFKYYEVVKAPNDNDKFVEFINSLI